MSTLKESAQTGRNLFWTHRGIDECGGGFLGLFLFKLLERNQKRKAEAPARTKARVDGFFDSLLDKIDSIDAE